jgi:Fe-S cluster assembly protein SufB
MATTDLDLGRYQLGWSDAEDYIFKPKKGLNESIVREMSEMKNEPTWMRDFRLKALKHFERKPMASWFAAHMPDLDFNDIYYYIKPTGGQVDDWEDLPDAIKNTYEKLGIPEAERKYLSGVTAQYESEVVFHRNRADLEEQGVLFCDMDTAVREYPELVRRWFGTLIPPNDNKFAALNSAVWSGGSFIYVPPGVKVEMPLQAYFRINAENMGQFERTLIIADEGLPGALHRRVLGSGLHHRLPALRGGRTGRSPGVAHHLYDHSELVHQRLQPGHQASPCRG